MYAVDDQKNAIFFLKWNKSNKSEQRNIIEKIIIDKEFHLIINIIAQSDNLEKCDIIELLEDYIYIPQIEKIILDNLSDKCYLVRCEVCESLRSSMSIFTFKELLMKLEKEKSKIVKMYIISSISSMCSNNNDLLKLLEKKKAKEYA